MPAERVPRAWLFCAVLFMAPLQRLRAWQQGRIGSKRCRAALGGEVNLRGAPGREWQS